MPNLPWSSSKKITKAEHDEKQSRNDLNTNHAIDNNARGGRPSGSARPDNHHGSTRQDSRRESYHQSEMYAAAMSPGHYGNGAPQDQSYARTTPAPGLSPMEAHRNRMRPWNITMKEAMDALQTRLTDLNNQLSTHYSSDRESQQLLVDDYEARLSSLRSEADNERKRLGQEHSKKLQEAEGNHQIELARERSDHEQKKTYLQNEMDRLNNIILKNDDDNHKAAMFHTWNLPQKPDDVIRNNMVDLQAIVDNLSRGDWKREQELWTDQVLQRISPSNFNSRALRKAVLQDSIWSQLLQYIFCSPFRMFGSAGRDLEREWNEQCGRGSPSSNELYSWPPPDVRAERWRYMTTKECREILKGQVPSHIDRRAELKTGYIQTLDKCVGGLKSELGQIIRLDSQNNDDIEKLVDKATAFWLNCGMHRCRLVVCMAPLATKSGFNKVHEIPGGQASLTIQPGLGRHGNVKGMELESFSTIKGCEGLALEVPSGRERPLA